MKNNQIKSILFGVATADALGVPVEFETRADLKQNPVVDMQEYGTYNQVKGTWSDDSSLTFCLAESIAEGLDLQMLANKFIAWKNDNYWTAHGWVFDIGIRTRIAIERLEKGEQPEYAGGFDEQDNGNGSLMRILPLVLLTKDLPVEERYELTKKVSSLTHGHIRSVIACFYYLEFAKCLCDGLDLKEAYSSVNKIVSEFLKRKEINPKEVELFNRVLVENIATLTEDEIESSGYVLHSLEASIWCLLTANSYEKAVLKAVNLGKDTDTNAAITGGLAALYYGYESIPQKWINVLAKKEEIEKLCNQFK